jgi:V8-like Glu-specific endopeptidase
MASGIGGGFFARIVQGIFGLSVIAITQQIACGGSDNRIPDAEANCGIALNTQPAPRRSTIPSRAARQVVQIRYYLGDELTDMTGTGVVVGRSMVLTVAHNLESDPGAYDRIAIAVRDANGVLHETPYGHGHLNSNYDRFNYAGDLAMIGVPIDFEALGITPATVATDYLPPRDCNDCPNSPNLEFYGYGNHNLEDGPLTGFTANPLNPVADIQATGVMTFQRTTRPGDSGGPYFRLHNRELQVVALHVGRDFYANARFEVRGSERGNHEVAVATTIQASVLRQLRRDAEEYANQNTGFFAPYFPPADPTLPNGAHNETADAYPSDGEAGPSVPVQGHGNTNGYFVHNYPLREVVEVPLPNRPGSCR